MTEVAYSGLTELEIQYYDKKLKSYRLKLKRFLAIKENRKALKQREPFSCRSEKQDLKICKLQDCIVGISEDINTLQSQTKNELDNLLSFYRNVLGISTKEDNCE